MPVEDLYVVTAQYLILFATFSCCKGIPSFNWRSIFLEIMHEG
jgi:hypothetical protein